MEPKKENKLDMTSEEINNIDSSGLKQGLWRIQYDTGGAYEGHYVNGVANGLWRDWYDNGQLSFECTYVNGNIHGLWTDWYEYGRLMYKTYHVNGIQEGESLMYEYED